MTTSTSCLIKLLNKTYDIKCPEHETENLALAVAKLNKELQANKKKFKHPDEFQNLLLAALHITHELVSCQSLQEEQRHQVTQFINSLDKKSNPGHESSINPHTD